MNCFVTEAGCSCWGWGSKNHILDWHLDPVHLICTKIAMDMVFDSKNKLTDEFIIFLEIQDGGLRSKVQNGPNLNPQITHQLRIWILFIRFRQNFGMDILLDIRNKPTEESLIDRKMQDGCRCRHYGKLRNLS